MSGTACRAPSVSHSVAPKPEGDFREKIWQPLHEARGCLPKSFCVHRLIVFS